jgi:type VI secretion system protein ImpC
MSDFNLDITAGRDRAPGQPIEDAPFRIALIGDWSGRGSRGRVESAGRIAARQPHQVDRDDLELAMEDLGVELALRVEGSGPPLTIRFRSLDDFHPDQLYARLPIFQALRDLRERLNDPREFAAAARQMSGEAPPPPPKPAAGGGLLDSILDDAAPVDTNEALAHSGGDLHAFLQQILKPHLIPRADPRQAELIAQVDAAASSALRAILHHPHFQALEANWRAADMLVRRIDTSSDLRIELIDLTQAELHGCLPPGQDPQQSPLYALLTRQSQTAPWALFASAFPLGPDDLDRAAQLAAIGHLLQAPWIAPAHPALAGVAGFDSAEPGSYQPSDDAGWMALRSSALARSLGLVVPRFLVRSPYGKNFDECETLRFEELDQPGHADFLWAPGSFAVALILGRARAEAGSWSLAGQVDPEIGGLSHVVFGKGADARSIPVAETAMTERGGARLMDGGLMVLASLKDQDRLRLLRVQSVAHPLAALAARWTVA